jgi:hypothetical protein
MSDEIMVLTTSVPVVPLLEVCDSMTALGYFEPAKAAVSAFIAMLGPAGRFALVTYGDEATQLFPAKGLAVWNDDTVEEGTSLLMAAVADNELVNWSAAIETGAAALAAPRRKRGTLFLLADGIWNTGTDPLLDLPRGVQICTFALGDNGQIEALRELAAATGGKFTLIDDPSSIGSVLINLIEELGMGVIVANSVRDVTPARPLSLTGTVQPDSASLRVALSWPDTSVVYTDQPPEAGEVSLKISDPNLAPYPSEPIFVTGGYAVFSIDDPQAGSWSFLVNYGGPGALPVNLAAIVSRPAGVEQEQEEEEEA